MIETVIVVGCVVIGTLIAACFVAIAVENI